jgi:superfamily II DNA/RNA helicase
MIVNSKDQNFIFQSKNGSGKTCSFAVPAVMAVNPSINDYQVIIFAHTRELIIQIEGIIKIMIKGSGVTVSIGDSETNMKTHILVTSVGYLSNILPQNRRGADKNMFSKVNLIVFDEADEIFKVESNQ